MKSEERIEYNDQYLNWIFNLERPDRYFGMKRPFTKVNLHELVETTRFNELDQFSFRADLPLKGSVINVKNALPENKKGNK